MEIRHAFTDDPREIDRLYEICLRTGAAGQDATADFIDDRLLGDTFLGAYLRLSPELAWVLAAPGEPAAGYLVGVADTAAFEERLERDWWPDVRRRLATIPVLEDSADARLRRLVREPPRAPADVAATYPAHFHIDLLPEAQGGGNGSRLIRTALDELRTRGVPGVHLGVDPANRNALGFYAHLGFEVLLEEPTLLTLALRL